jgi:hypothetical protein
MSSRNDITGDKLQSKLTTKAYEEGFDLIFGNKKKEKQKPEQLELDFDEVRMDIIGQNGNIGYNTIEEVVSEDSDKKDIKPQ